MRGYAPAAHRAGLRRVDRSPPGHGSGRSAARHGHLHSRVGRCGAQVCITVGGLLIEPIIKQLGTAAASLAVYTTAAAAMFIAYQFNTFYPTLAERTPTVSPPPVRRSYFLRPACTWRAW